MDKQVAPRPGDMVRHPSFPWALHFVGYRKERRPLQYLVEEEDEDGNVTERWEDDWTETEDVEDMDTAIVVAVGDDRRHEVDADELTAIEEDEDGGPGYCPSCGDLNCGHR